MCREIRRLYFSNKELGQALTKFSHVTKRTIPNTDNVDYSFVTEPDVRVKLALKGQTNAVATFLESELAASLIMFCNDNNIPLPRRGRKTLEVSSDQLVLRLDVER